MTDACKHHYESLHTETANVVAASFAGPHGSEMAKSHAFISDYELWIQALRLNAERCVYESALKEYQFSLLSLAFGHYRAAFSALRLTLELSFAGIQWSTNERELREWKLGQRDSNWQALIDRENGVLSKQFVALFGQGLAEEASRYLPLATAVYRECSEYVHGNAHTHYAMPEKLAFDQGLFTAWHEKASSARLTISFSLAARYIADLPPEARAQLETMVLEHLGHSSGIRNILGATTEISNV